MSLNRHLIFARLLRSRSAGTIRQPKAAGAHTTPRAIMPTTSAAHSVPTPPHRDENSTAPLDAPRTRRGAAQADRSAAPRVRPVVASAHCAALNFKRETASPHHVEISAPAHPGMRGAGFRAHRGAAAPAGPLRIRRGLLATLIVIFGIIGALFGAISAGVEPAAETTQLDMPLMSPADLPISTPKKSWKQGKMPYLYQTDPIWAQRPYGGGTVRDNACGPTAFTMAYVYLTGHIDYTPATMAAWADAHGYAPSGSTEWSFMTEGAAAFGVSSKMFDSNKDQISAALSQGKPVISLMNIGDFTNVGHFIVLSDIDDSGNVTVHDPASAWRSSHTWPIDTIVDQSTYSWALSL